MSKKLEYIGEIAFEAKTFGFVLEDMVEEAKRLKKELGNNVEVRFWWNDVLYVVIDENTVERTNQTR